MSTTLPATFRDACGVEQIRFETDGTWLRTEIRGVSFEGRGFDDLEPLTPTELFSLRSGSLWASILVVHFPVRLMAPEGLRHVPLVAEVRLGWRNTEEGAELPAVKVRLTQPEFELHSAERSAAFEDEILGLVAQLPTGFHLQACITCGLSDYSPAGTDSFGTLACFRNHAEEYRRVKGKDIFSIIDLPTVEYVQETHYCPQFEHRPKGRGYRG